MRYPAQVQAFIVIVLIVILSTGCASEPTAAFTADKTKIVAGESVKFTDQSVNDPTTWLWSFTGGIPSTSPLQDPTVTYSFPGVYTVTLEVRKRGASNIMTKDNYITVEPATTDLTFINNTYTNVNIEINGVEKTATGEGGQVTYFDIEANSINYYAETSGKTGTGTQIGLNLVWDYTLQLTGGAQNSELDIGDQFFFLRMTNNGTHNWSPIDIDHGADLTSTEYILIPMDGTRYNLGYYNAWSSTEVRAYWNDLPATWIKWNVNEYFTFPNALNQNIDLADNHKKSASGEVGLKSVSGEAGHLLPSSNFIPRKTLEEGTTRYFPNR